MPKRISVADATPVHAVVATTAGSIHRAAEKLEGPLEGTVIERIAA